MTAPVSYKSLKVSPEIHQAVHALSVKLGTSADGALVHLFNSSTEALNLTDAQRRRWEAYAANAGVSLAEWIVLRIEAAIAYGYDPGTMRIAMDHLRAITQHFDIPVTRTPPAGPRPTRTTPQED